MLIELIEFCGCNAGMFFIERAGVAGVGGAGDDLITGREVARTGFGSKGTMFMLGLGGPPLSTAGPGRREGLAAIALSSWS